MSWIDDSLPLPGARPVEGEEALEAALHALAAVAAGIAAMQLLTAAVLGQVFPTVFFSALLLATGACAFVGEGRRIRRAAYVAGGSAAGLVWLTLLFYASGPPIVVVLGMAGITATITRQLVVGEAMTSNNASAGRAQGPTPSNAWIDEDREGMLGATFSAGGVATIRPSPRD